MNKLKILKPIVFLAVTAGFSVVVMILWNWLMPSIFGLTTINFWHAVGILALCRILLGSFGGWHHNIYGNLVREKWAKMTPEQKQELIDKISKRRGHFGNMDGFFGRQDVASSVMYENTPKDCE